MRSLLAVAVVLSMWGSQSASAVECRNGVYRAGCVSPNGAAVVRKPPTQPHTTVVGPNGAAVVRRPSPSVECANGPNRAGCIGPNGAAGVRKY